MTSIWYARYGAIACAPGAEARRLESPRPAAGDGCRADRGCTAQSPDGGLRRRPLPGATRGAPGGPGGEGDGAKSPQPPFPACGCLPAPTEALRAPHLRLPPLASECFPALRCRLLPFAAAVAVAVAIGGLTPGPRCRRVLHATWVSGSPQLLRALCPGRPCRPAPRAKPRPLHGNWLQSPPAAPPRGTIGCSTTRSKTWRRWGLIQGIFFSLSFFFFSPAALLVAVDSRVGSQLHLPNSGPLLLTRCPSAFYPSQIKTRPFGGSSVSPSCSTAVTVSPLPQTSALESRLLQVSQILLPSQGRDGTARWPGTPQERRDSPSLKAEISVENLSLRSEVWLGD